MLKQYSSRNVRGKSLKVKHAVQVLVIISICVWFLYHLKQSSEYKESDQERVLKVGRKELKPRVGGDVEKHEDGVMEMEEIDAGEREKSEEVEVEVDHDQIQDFIDEDDREQLLVEA